MGLEEYNFSTAIFTEDISIMEECKDLVFIFSKTPLHGFSLTLKIIILTENLKEVY
jgi:hypothetical protein